MSKHTVKQGECLSSISDKLGFFWETIWNFSENTELKNQREDPNALSPGDILSIPDKTIKEENGATEQKHTFRLKGAPVKVKIRLMIDNEPLADKPYKLIIDGEWKEGTTDASGYLIETIPPSAKEGELVIGEGDDQNRCTFRLGTIDPLDDEEGIRQRLLDLGYDAEDDLPAAIKEFQKTAGLEETGIIDDSLRSKLKEKFGQ